MWKSATSPPAAPSCRSLRAERFPAAWNWSPIGKSDRSSAMRPRTIGGALSAAGDEDRHPHGDRRALAKLAFHGHLAAMQPGEGAHQGKAKSRPRLTLRRRARLLERPADTRQVLRRDAHAGVGHDNLQDFAHRMGAHRHRSAPGRELQRVRDQVEGDLLDRAPVGVGVQRFRRKLAAQADARPVGLAAHQAQDGRDRVAGVEILARQFEPRGLDLRHVEHVVDQFQQVRPALVDQVGVLGVAVRHRPEQPLPHDVGEAHDGVQRRPQLVAHVGQEPRLPGVLLLGLFARGLQIGLAVPLGAGVAHGGHQPASAHPAHGQLAPAVGVMGRGEGGFRRAVGRGAEQRALDLGAVVGRDQVA